MFTTAEKVDIRRFCGYGMFGAQALPASGYRFSTQYGTLEYKINNMLPEEEVVVRTCSCKHVCCSGKVPNQERVDAIAVLCHEAMSHVAGGLSHFALRKGIIERYFGERVKVDDLADLCGVHRTTVMAHSEKITRWLKGVNRDNPGAEAKAWVVFEDFLINTGLVKG